MNFFLSSEIDICFHGSVGKMGLFLQADLKPLKKTGCSLRAGEKIIIDEFVP